MTLNAKKRLAIRRRKQYEQIVDNKKNDPRYGYIHIPKTGGTSIAEYFKRGELSIVKKPILFPHLWNTRAIIRNFPDIKLMFILREPLERTVSGFNCRLRCGRPHYESPWNEKEAISFSMFRSVNEFLDACLASDDWSISATSFANKHIEHLKHNYQYYFGDLNSIKKIADKFIFIEDIAKIESFIEFMNDNEIVKYSNLDAIYKKVYSSNIESSKYLSNYSKDEINKLKKYFDNEYIIYNDLLKYRNNR